jgi:uncharacterized protein YaaN involved in tellurite resistance
MIEEDGRMTESAMVSSQAAVPAKLDAKTEVAVAPDPALVSRIRSEIRLNDRAQLLSFGDQAQRDVASYADQILRSTVNRDSGAVGNLLTDLLTSVNKLDPQSLRRRQSQAVQVQGTVPVAREPSRSYRPRARTPAGYDAPRHRHARRTL